MDSGAEPRNKVKMVSDSPAGYEMKNSAVDSVVLSIPYDAQMPHDVSNEYMRVVSPAADEEHPHVRLVRLEKRFYRGRRGALTAVDKLTLGINRNECFGLLGPNGAGKTTTLNVLCGLYNPSSGTATVGGLDIRRRLSTIRMSMGVCPQHDITWGDLTGEEHLLFYGRIKGLWGKALDKEVTRVLAEVQLTFARRRLVKAYSGGMRRRLSVACCFVGNPSTVYLDEPSTGLDPASRHNLWSVINVAKRGKSIVLTTHSMEEADTLCDRVGIMTEGALRCIGPAAGLKRRFGAGYTLSLSTVGGPDVEREMDLFVKDFFPSAVSLAPPIAGTYTYEVLKEDVSLAAVFKEMKVQESAFQITDWGITESTLEEVFQKIAHADSEILTREDRSVSTGLLKAARRRRAASK